MFGFTAARSRRDGNVAREIPITILIFVVGFIGASGLFCSGCDSTTSPAETAQWQTLRSDLDRDLNPAVSGANLDSLAAGNVRFTLDLYAALLSGKDEAADANLLISPLSIRTAFAMAYGGAREQTATEIARTLHYELDQEQLHPAFNALDLELDARNAPASEQEDPLELHLANAIWGKLDFPFHDTYLDLLAINYGSGLQSLDFAGAPEASRQVINGWVEEQTHDRIKDLLPPNAIKPSTAVVITNAVYFKGPWASPFNPDATADDAFTLLDASTRTVPFMQQAGAFNYAVGDGWQALELPFREDRQELAMVFLLPAAGQFTTFEASLTSESLVAMLAALTTQAGQVQLPKFSFESSFPLSETLQAMGMVVPFSAAADFSGIGDRSLYIDEVYHKTFIDVNEKGAEAAAATAIVMNETSIPEDFVFTANRPFLTLIRDRVTGVVLFFGRVLDPSAG